MSDSDDSDGEGGLGNVSRVIIRPPGHSGKAKRGHLCFDAAFETGNLGRADLVGEFEYDLYLRPDTCNPRFRFWFNFTVDNVKQDQRVIFNIVNMNKSRNLFLDGLTPLVKSTGRPKWQRIPRQHTFYYRSTIHQNHYVLSFAFAFDKEDEVYQFTIAAPYSYSRLQSYLSVLETKFGNIFQRTVIGSSLQNRKLDLLTVDHLEKPLKIYNKNQLKVIVILARIHGGESPSSYLCQGFIEFILGGHPIAVILRENFIFKIIPMMNPDGVFLGNNRCNLIGQDLNRSWNVATEFSHPTIFATKSLLKEIDESNGYQLDFVIDIHAHSSLLGSFIYGNTYEDVYRYERHLVFPKLLSTNAHDFSPQNMTFNADDRKSGSTRRFCCEQLSDTVNSYTLQISMCGYLLKGTQVMVQYTEDAYMRFGRNLGRTLFEYYRFINVLPVEMIADIHLSRKHRPKTHRPPIRRSRSQTNVQSRPKTTRTYAPISYTDLSIHYDSGSSTECSPTRYGYRTYLGCGFGTRQMGNIYMNQHHLSMKLNNHLAIPIPIDYDDSKFRHLKFNNRFRLPTMDDHIVERRTDIGVMNVAPKPCLSIIDFNQLTRGGLEEAIKKPSDKRRLLPKS